MVPSDKALTVLHQMLLCTCSGLWDLSQWCTLKVTEIITRHIFYPYRFYVFYRLLLTAASFIVLSCAVWCVSCSLGNAALRIFIGEIRVRGERTFACICHAKGILLPKQSLCYSRCVSSFWDWYTCIATRHLHDQLASISPTPDGFPETTIRI